MQEIILHFVYYVYPVYFVTLILQPYFFVLSKESE